MLIDLRRSGLCFAEIARQMRTTKGSVLSRYHRLNGIVFKSRVLNHEKKQLARAERREERAAVLNERVATMLDWMASGMARAEAIRRANQQGLPFRTIGAALGISGQAAHQAALRT
jgi:hypothetical protein